MNRRTLSYNLTEEDWLTRTKWMRGMAAFYGCITLLIFGIIVLTKVSSPVPDQASRLQAARGNSGADLSGKAQ